AADSRSAFAPEAPDTKPRKIAAICLLNQAPARTQDGVSVRRVAAGEALTGLLTHAHEFDPSDAARRTRMLATYLSLADSHPGYEVTFRPGLEKLDAVLDAIEAALQIAPERESELAQA